MQPSKQPRISPSASECVQPSNVLEGATAPHSKDGWKCHSMPHRSHTPWLGRHALTAATLPAWSTVGVLTCILVFNDLYVRAKGPQVGSVPVLLKPTCQTLPRLTFLSLPIHPTRVMVPPTQSAAVLLEAYCCRPSQGSVPLKLPAALPYRGRLHACGLCAASTIAQTQHTLPGAVKSSHNTISFL